MSCSTIHVRSWLAGPVASNTIDPNTMPVSVEATLMLARTVRLSPGARVCAVGRSQSLRSPTVASSRVRFAMVSEDWLTMSTSSTMSYWCTVTKASAYTGSDMPVSCVTRFSLSEKSSVSPPVAASWSMSMSWSSSSSSTSAPPGLSWRTLMSASAWRSASGATRSGCLAASPGDALLPALALAESARRSASSAALRCASMAAKESWQFLRKSSDTCAVGRLRSMRHALRRSAESASMRGSALPDPRRSIATRMDITSATTRLAIRASLTCSRLRRASLVSVDPTELARKKSPARMSSRSF
mmetsp:Transcript_28704/g.77307  ORF Transcript_28704/g.77307 Transcript_28704/m.77307 type:complete len:301 (-) Transcript_28704:1697-2599(-)